MSKSDDRIDEDSLQEQFEQTLPFRIAKMQVRQQSYDEGFAAGRAQGRAEIEHLQREVEAYQQRCTGIGGMVGWTPIMSRPIELYVHDALQEAEQRGRAEGREEAAKVVEAPITAHKESAEAARRMLATPLAAHHQSLYVAIRDSERTKAETLEWAAVEIRAIAKRITEAEEGNDGK